MRNSVIKTIFAFDALLVSFDTGFLQLTVGELNRHFQFNPARILAPAGPAETLTLTARRRRQSGWRGYR
jgi:hypothetical protein